MKKLLIFLVASSAILTFVTNHFILKEDANALTDKLGNGVDSSPCLLRMNRTAGRENYTVFSNFVRGRRRISCEDQLITLTTQSDYRYLNNLIPLVERWASPVSIALYVPYDDLDATLRRIAFIRECTTPLVKEWISFHLYSETRHFPHTGDEVLKLWGKWSKWDELCSTAPGFNMTDKLSRSLHNLTYPVNVGRNIARAGAKTAFILASDIELFPSVNFVPEFFKMLQRRHHYFQNRSSPYVFVLPVFEVEKDHALPDTKDQLIDLIKRRLSIPFHKLTCTHCQKIPNYEAWLRDNGTENELNVFYVTKRNRTRWEPLYVSTNSVPLYDEGISWEDRGDKMSQSYALCVLDYDFMILGNAFLVHKPGIKRRSKDRPSNQIRNVRERIILASENRVRKKYGGRKSC